MTVSVQRLEELVEQQRRHIIELSGRLKDVEGEMQNFTNLLFTAGKLIGKQTEEIAGLKNVCEMLLSDTLEACAASDFAIDTLIQEKFVTKDDVDRYVDAFKLLVDQQLEDRQDFIPDIAGIYFATHGCCITDEEALAESYNDAP